MKLNELIREILVLGAGQSSHETRLYARLLLRFLADHVRELQFDDGSYLQSISDFEKALRLVADGLRVPLSPPLNFADHRLRASGRVADEDWCHDCGHLHADPTECGFPIGGGRVCLCDKAFSRRHRYECR